MRTLIIAGLLCIAMQVMAQKKTENVVLITMDGFRWQELFGGGVDSLILDKKYVNDTAALHAAFLSPDRKHAREKLMPWFWKYLAKNGQIYGNRWEKNYVNCTNSHWFSYPGYNEILTGYSDPYVNSNEKKYNQNVTVLEWLNNQPELRGNVAAFCSWDVFPYIINDQRSSIPVNAGYPAPEGSTLSSTEHMLYTMQEETPGLYGGMRWDVYTHHFALDYLQRKHPRVVYIAYGETDDFAHDGKYDQYLYSAHQTDQWIKEVWEFLQSDAFYKDKTTVIITTDHGRGDSPKDEWRSHGKIFSGSPDIWYAVIGPDTPPDGELTTPGQHYQNQVAATLARFLGYKYESPLEIGESVDGMFNTNLR